jgi:hypothetical protein
MFEIWHGNPCFIRAYPWLTKYIPREFAGIDRGVAFGYSASHDAFG